MAYIDEGGNVFTNGKKTYNVIEDSKKKGKMNEKNNNPGCEIIISRDIEEGQEVLNFKQEVETNGVAHKELILKVDYQLWTGIEEGFGADNGPGFNSKTRDLIMKGISRLFG